MRGVYHSKPTRDTEMKAITNRPRSPLLPSIAACFLLLSCVSITSRFDYATPPTDTPIFPGVYKHWCYATEGEYFNIIDKKTAALLSCCIESGGLYAGANTEEAEALKRFGHYFGLAFQIIDDCLDFTGNEHEFGKTLGADCVAGGCGASSAGCG